MTLNQVHLVLKEIEKLHDLGCQIVENYAVAGNWNEHMPGSSLTKEFRSRAGIVKELMNVIYTGRLENMAGASLKLKRLSHTDISEPTDEMDY